jgi:hypothetical protein
VAPEPDAAVKELFGDLAVGGGPVGDYRVERVCGVYLGAIPVVMSTATGLRFQVDVLRRDDGGPRGIANTDRLSLFLANRGGGSQQTDEQQGLAIIALRDALSARENSAEVQNLLTFDERRRAFREGVFSVQM